MNSGKLKLEVGLIVIATDENFLMEKYLIVQTFNFDKILKNFAIKKLLNSQYVGEGQFTILCIQKIS